MFRSKKIEHLLQGRPTIVVRNGEILKENMEREFLSVEDLRILLRKTRYSRLKRNCLRHTGERRGGERGQKVRAETTQTLEREL